MKNDIERGLLSNRVQQAVQESKLPGNQTIDAYCVAERKFALEQSEALIQLEQSNMQQAYCFGFANFYASASHQLDKPKRLLEKVWSMADGNNFLLGYSEKLKPGGVWSDCLLVFAYPWQSLHAAYSWLGESFAIKPEIFWGWLRLGKGWMHVPSVDFSYRYLPYTCAPLLRARKQWGRAQTTRQLLPDTGQEQLQNNHFDAKQLSLALPLRLALPWSALRLTFGWLGRTELRQQLRCQLDQTITNKLAPTFGKDVPGWSHLLSEPRFDKQTNRNVVAVIDNANINCWYLHFSRMLGHRFQTTRRFSRQAVLAPSRLEIQSCDKLAKPQWLLQDVNGACKHHLDGASLLLLGLWSKSSVEGHFKHRLATVATAQLEPLWEKSNAQVPEKEVACFFDKQSCADQDVDWATNQQTLGLRWETGLGSLCRWLLGSHLAPGLFVTSGVTASEDRLSGYLQDQVNRHFFSIQLMEEEAWGTGGAVRRSVTFELALQGDSKNKIAPLSAWGCRMRLEEQFRPLWSLEAKENVFPYWQRLLNSAGRREQQAIAGSSSHRLDMSGYRVLTQDYTANWCWQQAPLADVWQTIDAKTSFSGPDLLQAIKPFILQDFREGVLHGALKVAERFTLKSSHGTCSLYQQLTAQTKERADLLEKSGQLQGQWSWRLFNHIQQIQQQELQLEATRQWLMLDPLQFTSTQRKGMYKQVIDEQNRLQKHLTALVAKLPNTTPNFLHAALLLAKPRVTAALFERNDWPFRCHLLLQSCARWLVWPSLQWKPKQT